MQAEAPFHAAAQIARAQTAAELMVMAGALAIVNHTKRVACLSRRGRITPVDYDLACRLRSRMPRAWTEIGRAPEDAERAIEEASSRRRRPRQRAALTFEEAEEIRRRYAAGGVTQLDLAGDYDVTQRTISSVVRGVTHTRAEPDGTPEPDDETEPDAEAVSTDAAKTEQDSDPSTDTGHDMADTTDTTTAASPITLTRDWYTGADLAELTGEDVRRFSQLWRHCTSQDQQTGPKLYRADRRLVQALQALGISAVLDATVEEPITASTEGEAGKPLQADPEPAASQLIADEAAHGGDGQAARVVWTESGEDKPEMIATAASYDPVAGGTPYRIHRTYESHDVQALRSRIIDRAAELYLSRHEGACIDAAALLLLDRAGLDSVED